jgi:GntR family transcriptional repressor for pyruvate dehydrogenase complex
MQRLAERGRVSVEVGRGTFVRQPDTQRLAEQLGLLVQLDRSSYWQITEARRMIETQTAALAAARRTDAQLEAMREALTAMDASMTDIEGFAGGDERFHLAIAAAADNEVLAMFNQQLQAMIRGTRREVFSVIEISPQAQEYHWTIYRAIERRAPSEAMAAVNGHLEEMEDYVRRALRGRPGSGDVT